MLQINNLCVKYDNIQVLHGISMEIKEGELVALIGANGAGKTTTLTTLSGVKRSFAGEIIYKGKNIAKASTDEIVKSGIVHVPEGRQIFSRMTIEENLILGAYTEKNAQRQKENMEKEMLSTINKMGIGPGGLGGTTTAFAVNVETYPTHIAGLPVAVSICCHVNRHITRTI